MNVTTVISTRVCPLQQQAFFSGILRNLALKGNITSSGAKLFSQYSTRSSSPSSQTSDCSDHQPVDDGSPVRNVVAVARGTFDQLGGTLTSEETGVSIIIPAGAINDGELREIYFKVCQDSTMLPPLDKEKGETLLSPLVMCGPHGQKFNVPVELRLPHSAAVNPESWTFALKSSDATEGAAAEWQNTSLDGAGGGAFSQINDNYVSVLVDHF